jgi:thiol-disulfide isomerase/thioredoxin
MWKCRIVVAVLCLSLILPLVQAANIPRKSPEFAISMTGGKQLLLSSYKGKAIALIFILTYCPHCQKTVQLLSKLQPEYGPKGFQALGSAIEDMAAMAVPGFIKNYNPPFPFGFNERNVVLDYLQHPVMNRLIMPQLVFVDKNFTVRAQYTGDDKKFFPDDPAAMEKNIRAQIEVLLKDGNGSGGASTKKAASVKKKKTT